MPRSSSPQAATRFAIPRALMAGFVVAAFATLVIAIVNFRSAEARADAVHAMDRTSLAMRQLNFFNVAVRDAETSQRGYLLTGDMAYLQPYQQAVTALSKHLAELEFSSKDYPTHQQLVTQLEELTQLKLRELNETLALRKNGDAVGAMGLVHSGAGKSIMDRMRDVAESLRVQQNQQLAERRQEWVNAASNSNLYSAGGSMVLLALICLSAAITAREYRAKSQQSWVSAGLTGLGQRIQGDHRLEDVGQLALEYLATYLRAQVGAGYVADRNGGFTLFGGYALPRERLAQKLLSDEGLVGQAARAPAAGRARCTARLPAGLIQHRAGQPHPAADCASRGKRRSVCRYRAGL